MNQRSQLICAWTAGISVVFLAIGFFLVTGYVPPPHANESARQIAHFYASHHTRLQVGLVITLLAWSGYGPLVAVISTQMLRIEGNQRPVLALLQAVAGTAGWVCLLIPTMLLLVVTFRPDRSPALTQTLHDLAWITAFMAVPPFVVELGAIAGAISQDRSPEPAYPRWLGYFNVWAAILFIPGVLLIFFKTGPLSYQGLLVFWIPFIVFGAWILVMAWAARCAALTDQPTADSTPGEARVAVGAAD